MSSVSEPHTPLMASSETQVLAIIGDPISQAKSPQVFADYFQRENIDAVLVPLHVRPPDLRRVIDSLHAIVNFAGLVITIPHKPAACALADDIGPLAAACGAANALVPLGDGRWQADMFDGVGLLKALEQRQVSIAGRKTLVVGAGGAGAAIVAALRTLGGVGPITIADIDSVRARQLAARFPGCVSGPADPAGFELVVNASPCGMASDDCPLDSARLSPDAIVCDAIMQPPHTRLLLEARQQHNCTIVAGLEMLQGQVQALVDFFALPRRREFCKV